MLATLTGWGLIWLLLRERQLGGTIILADAHIRYIKPVIGRPGAIADLGSLSGDLDQLAPGRKARVQLYGNDVKGPSLKAFFWSCRRRWIFLLSEAAPTPAEVERGVVPWRERPCQGSGVVTTSPWRML